MRVSELMGAQLNYWVAKAIGKEAEIFKAAKLNEFQWIPEHCKLKSSCEPAKDAFGNSIIPTHHSSLPYGPSTNWEHGGRLIEEYCIALDCRTAASAATYRNSDGEVLAHYIADTPLIAAMRCIVASKYGEEVGNE